MKPVGVYGGYLKRRKPMNEQRHIDTPTLLLFAIVVVIFALMVGLSILCVEKTLP